MAIPAPGKAQLNMGGWVVPAHLSPEVKATGRCASLVVAANDSSALAKQQADYICDGVADQVQINAALALGETRLLEGKFTISAPIQMDGLFSHLSGAGHAWEMGGTQIYLAGGSNCNMIEMDGTAAHIFFPTISSLYLNGNRSQQTSGYGIYCPTGDTVSDQMIFGVAIQNTYGEGIRLLGGWYSILDRVWCEYCGNGAYIGTKAGISHCVFSENYGRGLAIGGQAIVSDSFFYNNSYEGIYATYSTSKIADCLIFGNSNGNVGVYSGISVHGDADYMTIFGNTIDGLSRQKYGIDLLTGTDYCNIKDNTIKGNVTAPIGLAAGVNTNGQIGGNIGHVTEASGTDTLTSAATTKVVTHGLAVTPSAGDIMVTPMESLSSASFWWIDTYTATQFTIHVNTAPGADTDFAWKAIVL